MKKDITPTAAVAQASKRLGKMSAQLRAVLPDGGDRGVGRYDGADAADLCGPRYGREDGRRGHRWGQAEGKIGFHGGKMSIAGRGFGSDGHEMTLPSWEAAQAEDWLGRWAMNLMLINVSTRRFRRAVRLPEGDIPAPNGAGVSKSAASRRFVALSAERMGEWMAADLSKLDLLVIQIDGVHIGNDLSCWPPSGSMATGSSIRLACSREPLRMPPSYRR